MSNLRRWPQQTQAHLKSEIAKMIGQLGDSCTKMRGHGSARDIVLQGPREPATIGIGFPLVFSNV